MNFAGLEPEDFEKSTFKPLPTSVAGVADSAVGKRLGFDSWIAAHLESIPESLAEPILACEMFASMAANQGTSKVYFGFASDGSGPSAKLYGADGALCGEIKVSSVALSQACEAGILMDCSDPSSPKTMCPDQGYFQRSQQQAKAAKDNALFEGASLSLAQKLAARDDAAPSSLAVRSAKP